MADLSEPLTALVITVSDRSARGERKDAAGPALAGLLANNGYEVVGTRVVADERPQIEEAIRAAASSDVALCVTTGGTGLAVRDVTPEATAAVCERMVPGIGEAMRAASATITPFAWLSRATAGTLGRTLVVNVPGSPKAAVENLSAVLEPLAHGIKTLRAQGPLDCARERADVRALASRPCILFDLDGTLANTMPGIVSTARRVLLDWGMGEGEIGDLRRLIGPPFPAAFSLVYGLSEADAAEVTRRYRAIYNTLGPESHPLFEGIAQLLEDLRAQGRRLAITSSKREPMVRRVLRDNGVEGLFEAIVAQQNPARADKTHLVEDTLAALGCTPEDAVMVGDRNYDVEGATANGVATIGVYYGATAPAGELECAGACVCARTVAELRGLLMGGAR